MRIGGDANAAIDPAPAQGLAFAAAAFIVESRERLVEQSLVIAAVVHDSRAAVGPIAKFRRLNEIRPPHFDLVELEVACHRIDRALGYVSAFGPAIAAIGINRHGVGHDDAGNSLIVVYLVSAGAKVDGIHGRTAT